MNNIRKCFENTWHDCVTTVFGFQSPLYLFKGVDAFIELKERSKKWNKQK